MHPLSQPTQVHFSHAADVLLQAVTDRFFNLAKFDAHSDLFPVNGRIPDFSVKCLDAFHAQNGKLKDQGINQKNLAGLEIYRKTDDKPASAGADIRDDAFDGVVVQMSGRRDITADPALVSRLDAVHRGGICEKRQPKGLFNQINDRRCESEFRT